MTTARSTATGTAGSGSATDARAPPSPDARPGSATGPVRQKITLYDQLPDFGMELSDLELMVPHATLAAVRENLRQALDRLPLPGADLVRMNLVTRRNLLKRLIAP